jgi:DNA-directed RNA polymerase specialized sigma24 family protein
MMRDCGNCLFARTCRQQSCAAGRPTPWYETPEEIEAGLAWGDRKEFLMRWLRRRMGRVLSRRQQVVVDLRLFRGMTFNQISKLTGVDRSVVCRAMKRSVVRLRRLWEAEQAVAPRQRGAKTKAGAKRKRPGGTRRPPAC